MTEWKRYESIFHLEVCRPGWRGAMDAVVSAITRAPRLTVRVPATVSIHSTGPVDIAVFQVKEREG